MRIRRRRRRAAPVPGPAVERRDRLVCLLDVVTSAIELQPDAEEIIEACSWPGDTPVWVARRGSRIAAAYCRLYGWAADLSRNTETESVQARAAQLIAYHATMVDMCLKLAFPNVRSARLDHRRLGLQGLGEPAEVLRDLRVILLLWLGELDV